jgi:hypothetical protein
VVSFSTAKAIKGLATNTRAIEFIRESASTKTTNKAFAILDKASDWNILMDRYENNILGDLVVSFD